MKKLRIILALIRWLYFEPHPNGVKHTVNKRISDGKTWFIVEPAVIWLTKEQSQTVVRDSDGQTYIKIGGGSQAGTYVAIGNINNFLNLDDEYPETFDEMNSVR